MAPYNSCVIVGVPMRAGSRSAPTPSNSQELGLKVGDDVEHPAFGEGVIIDISGTGDKAEAVINFAGVGQKHLALAWAPAAQADDPRTPPASWDPGADSWSIGLSGTAAPQPIDTLPSAVFPERKVAPVARELAARFQVLEPFQRGSGSQPLTVERHVEDLQQQPREDQVGGRHAKDVPALELLEQTHVGAVIPC